MGTTIDWGRTSDDYAKHRAGFPDEAFARLKARGLYGPGAAVLDLGTGTGTLARGFYERMCHVTALDVSAAQVEAARASMPDAYITWKVAPAEHTGLAAGHFETVIAGQCWHWFDRPRAAAEAWRVLRRGGHLVIAHFDFLRRPGNAVDRAIETLQRTLAPEASEHGRFGRHGLYPDWLDDLATQGFEAIESESFDVDVVYSHEAWRGRMRASQWVSASKSTDAVARFDAAHGEALATLPDPMTVPHRVFFAIGRRPKDR